MNLKEFRGFLLPCLLGFVSFFAAHGQSWELMNPKPSSDYLQGVSFLSADTGFICGYNGTLLRTTDQGSNWQAADLGGFSEALWDITFVDHHKGFSVGNMNSIYRTDDAGESWERLPDPGGLDLNFVRFLDPQNGWACGTYRTLVRTRDGGDNWDLLYFNLGSFSQYSCLDFINPDTGYIAGYTGIYPQQGLLCKTTDGGETFTPIQLPSGSERITCMEVLSDNELWLGETHQAAGWTYLHHTTDGGATWSTVFLQLGSPTAEEIEFLTPMTGRVLAGYQIFVTSDGGQTWTPRIIMPYPDILSGRLFDIDWIDEDQAVVVGINGYIYRTEDSGWNWEELSSGARSNFSAICFIDSQKGYAGGSYFTSEYLYATEDGGVTWNPCLTDTVEGWICDIQFLTSWNGWTAGFNGRLRHTSTGGVTWIPINPLNDNTTYYTVCPVSSSVVWAGGGGSALIRSADAGITWENYGSLFPGYDIRKIIFTDDQNGYIILWQTGMSTSLGEMYKTTDGGVTWTGISYINAEQKKIRAVSFCDKNTGVISIAGKGIARTTDGGLTWTLFPNIDETDIVYLRMFDALQGVASDFYGNVSYTFDGGLTWSHAPKVDRPVGGINGFWFNSMDLGWMCKDGGLIKKYTCLNVGEEEQMPEKEVSQVILYPNPSSEWLNIRTDEPIRGIDCYTLQGSLVQSYPVRNKKVDIGQLPAGVFILKVTFEGHVSVLKFLKF